MLQHLAELLAAQLRLDCLEVAHPLCTFPEVIVDVVEDTLEAR